jgi:Ca2+-binding EF-hand superfamily protein
MKPNFLFRLVPLLFAASVAVYSPVMAQDANQIQQLEQRFKEANKSGDGKLTREEAKAGMPKIAKNFDRLDKDHKGYLTVDDIKAAMVARGK